MAKASIYSTLFNDGKLKDAWESFEKSRTEMSYGCIETCFAPPKGIKSQGHAQVRFKRVKYYCHILATMIQLNRAPAAEEEASHLCSNGKCVNPAHMTFEDGLLNKSRICCRLFLGKHPNYICPHNPYCFVLK